MVVCPKIYSFTCVVSCTCYGASTKCICHHHQSTRTIIPIPLDSITTFPSTMALGLGVHMLQAYVEFPRFSYDVHDFRIMKSDSNIQSMYKIWDQISDQHDIIYSILLRDRSTPTAIYTCAYSLNLSQELMLSATSTVIPCFFFTPLPLFSLSLL